MSAFSVVEICNTVVEEADVCLFGRYGNLITLGLHIKAQDGWCGNFMPTHNLTRDIGFVLKGLFMVIGGFEPDDFTPFSKLKGRPIRVVSAGNKFIGIGNFMEDRWLLESEVEKWAKGDKGTWASAEVKEKIEGIFGERK